MRAGHVAGKTYTVDAIAAARAVISGQATTAPEAHDGAGEALWALQIVHRSSMKSRTQAPNQLHALVVTAPNRSALNCAGGAARNCSSRCQDYRPGTSDDLVSVTRH